MKSLTAVRKKSPNYPVEFKIKMVELSHRPEISVAQLAREHGINDNLLFKWRQYWREGKLRPPSTTENNVPELLPITLDAEDVVPTGAVCLTKLISLTSNFPGVVLSFHKTNRAIRAIVASGQITTNLTTHSSQRTTNATRNVSASPAISALLAGIPALRVLVSGHKLLRIQIAQLLQHLVGVKTVQVAFCRGRIRHRAFRVTLFRCTL